MNGVIEQSILESLQEITFMDSLRIMRKKNRTILTLGENSYMVGCFYNSLNLNCHVLIGKYTSLADKLTLLLAINHHKDYATNYPFEISYKDGMPNFMEEQKHISTPGGGKFLLEMTYG